MVPPQIRPGTTQLLAGKFVVAAGSVLFRRSKTNALEICLVYDTTKKQWILPKGRKDRGEAIEEAAVRETFEETGYTCKLWPQRMVTRATVAGVNAPDVATVGDNLIEPFAITIRDLKEDGIKVISWFITLVNEEEGKAHGTQTESETFDSVFVEAGDAVERLTFQGDREVAQQALDIVNANYN
ncbi:NUDIX hydrolase domain-like protein [Collybia nuda]|uniref:NUDIX hydrolase domain-like protein n=1 Tax=Collybia nuda TaxID=64659 RepID=A0A9P6CID9_9AGAR|nr:NUDIX hydrolase domain-like protein [Collybia nuda]